MAEYIFQKIAKEGKERGVTPGSDNAIDWFRDKALSVNQVNVQKEMRNTAKLQNKLIPSDIGRMYHFFYDPKHKDTLPYWDKFPLIFVIDFYQDGFLGLNLHYIPPIYRIRLMDAIYSIARDDKVRQSKKARMTYGLLKGAAKFKYFKPCIKRYLTNHVKSRYLYVPFEEWDIAAFLPTQRFQKAKKTRVWNDSKQIL